MSNYLPKEGDFIEAEDDNVASNAPWTHKVVKVLPSGYMVAVGDSIEFFEIPDEYFYNASVDEDGVRFCYAKSTNASTEELPTSTVPIQSYNDSSIDAYKEGVIYPDNAPVAEEEDVDPLRQVSLEDSGSVIYFMDVTDKSYERASNLLEASMKDGVILNDSMESYKEIKNILSSAGDKLSNLVSSRQDICYNSLKILKEVEEKLKDYTPSDVSYKTKHAKDIRVNNSLEVQGVIAAGKRQISLAKFISERYKDSLKDSILSIITEINKQSKKNYLDKKLDLLNPRNKNFEIAKDIKESLTLNLVDLIVGVSEKRELLGGYILERVSDWKNNLINIVSVLRLSSVHYINVGRLISFSRDSYKGDGVVKPISKKEAGNLLSIAKELLELSKVPENKITFGTDEFSGLIDKVHDDLESSGSLNKNKEASIKKQIVGISMFPMKVIYRNIAAANALIKFVDEAIERGKDV